MAVLDNQGGGLLAYKRKTHHMDDYGQHDQGATPSPVGVPGYGSFYKEAESCLRDSHPGLSLWLLGSEQAIPPAGGGRAWVSRASTSLDSALLFKRYFNAVQVLSGLNAVIVFAKSLVSFPRFFPKMT